MRRILALLATLVLAGCGNSPVREPKAGVDMVALHSSLRLDQEAIRSDSAIDLATKAREKVFKVLEKSPGGDASALALPQHWRPVYTAFLLDAEVNNGGFHQFFWNTQGQLNDATLQDLEFIKATPAHGLFARAVAVYSGHDYDDERKRSGNSWKGFTEAYLQKRFEELDSEYYKLKTDLNEVVGNFIKNHPELYCAQEH